MRGELSVEDKNHLISSGDPSANGALSVPMLSPFSLAELSRPREKGELQTEDWGANDDERTTSIAVSTSTPNFTEGSNGGGGGGTGSDNTAENWGSNEGDQTDSRLVPVGKRNYGLAINYIGIALIGTILSIFVIVMTNRTVPEALVAISATLVGVFGGIFGLRHH